MSMKFHGFLAAALGAALVATPSAEARRPVAPATPAQPGQATQPNPTFRVSVDLVTNDIVVRDEKGNFVPDLRPEDIEVYEDGIKQELTSMTVVTGGRVYNPMNGPIAPPPQRIILPKKGTPTAP